MFQEVKESEDERDERIRKAIIAVVQWAECFNASGVTHESAEMMLAWLEKQKEQKFTEKQDYSDLTDLERAIHRGFLVVGVENVPVTIIKETAQDCLAWMKPAEWSEEDKEMVRRAIFYTEQYRTNYGDTKESEECFNWLLDLHRNIRPPFHWRPSGDQMEALAWYSGNSGVPPTGDKAIKSLYNDLKAL